MYFFILPRFGSLANNFYNPLFLSLSLPPPPPMLACLL